MLLAQASSDTSVTGTDRPDRHDDAHNTVIVRDSFHTETMCFDMQTQPAEMHANHDTCTTVCHYTGNTWLAINSLHAMAMTTEDP